MKYSYTFKALKRSCGHVEDLINHQSSYAYGPKVKEYLEKELCTVCSNKWHKENRKNHERAIEKGKKILTDKGIDIRTASFQSINNNTKVEVTLWLDV